MILFIMDVRNVLRSDQKTEAQLALKVSEESGELSEAVLCHTEAHGTKYKSEKLKDVEHVVEESADVIICAIATALRASNGDADMLDRWLKTKLAKYDRVVHERW